MVEQAWDAMRAQNSKPKGKKKAGGGGGSSGGADGWALEEVADWVVETLVRQAAHSCLDRS